MKYEWVKRDDLYDLSKCKNNYVESSLADKPPAFFDLGENPDTDYEGFGESDVHYAWARKEVDYILVRVMICGGNRVSIVFYYGVLFEPHIDSLTSKQSTEQTLPYFFESVKDIDNL